MSQYNNISVFKNTKRTKDSQPLYNVKIDMADGTKWEGGLWLKTSKSGIEYLGGDLKPPFNRDEEQRRPSRPQSRQAPAADDDIPVDW